ncbi:MAG TPA: alpha/beta hydrolase [Oscillatoriales cyanobacterium M59_W2019_021]|nr:MAG: alpha/beta hydrolase [Cyanobacteria bacterium J055]HIK29801.1 alpha/beta hydrolase [Oscillatoriales cyanobacterium M4454_W2019_049]HIK50581.1 alpha/beta hydrolase [Oscillatoriales cyanobacterium M59_W2019_021]
MSAMAYIGVILAIVYGGACLLLRFVQHRLIFVPSPIVELQPEDWQLDPEDVWLQVASETEEDAERIHGWWIPASPSTDSQNVLLYLHGNSGNLSRNYNLDQIRRFSRLGFSVLAIDYRGYGRSSDRFPNEARVYEDARIGLQYLMDTLKIAPERIFLFGHSLGGAIAIETATHHRDLAGLIIEGSFTSILEVANNRKSYAMFPLDLILTQRFNSIDKVATLTMPILFIHGTDDSVVPSFMSEKLYAAATAEKQLYLVPQAGHNDVAAIAGEENYLEKVRQFVRQVRDRQHFISDR